MKKNKFISLALLAVMVLSVGCSDGSTVSNTSTVSPSQSSGSGNALSLEGIADNEVSANVSEDATANDTTFRLNRVIDSGKTDDSGNPYIYLDVNISNSTATEYELSVLNNFYVLLADNSEIHFDIKTQLHATNNIENYSASPFAVPANGEFSGIIGGFVLPKDTQDFTVCFFPTQDNKSDKSNVVKVSVSAQNMEKLG
ncbi:MAG: hypothetical protein NC340_02045 [Ruminococcus flavefaciens]|nr:hypothetical protein [Ruminococcus flavefaciens]MCM1228928.1 hypothetical protein [Ruminococcus flavefaciens]